MTSSAAGAEAAPAGKGAPAAVSGARKPGAATLHGEDQGSESAGPAPLLSTSGGPHVFSRSKLVPSSIDPFDVFDSTRGGDAADPWSADDAEALTRVYEASGLAPAPRTPVSNKAPFEGGAHDAAADVEAAAAPSQAPDAVGLKPSLSLMEAARAVADDMDHGAHGASAGAAAAPATHVALAPTIERAWLEERFAEIATRVEQSLAAMQSQDSLQVLDERLGQFEERFGKVLDGVSNRSDPEEFRQVESQINDLAEHVENAQLQLQRLDTIEAQLNAVMEKLSDQRMQSFISEVGSRDIDVQAIARSAAEQVAQRLNEIAPGQTAGSEDAGRIEELRSLINSFMIERREGEEQTAGMLDTMQQAMIRLLDRVDSLELASTGAHEGYAVYDTPTDDSHYAPAPAVASPAPAGRQEPQHGEALRDIGRAHHYEPVDETAVEHDVAAAAPVAQPAQRQAAAAQRVAAPAAEASAGAGAAQGQSRDQLIAEARRAMIAAARQQQEEQAAAEAEAEAQGKGKGKKGGKGAGKAKKVADKPASSGGLSTTTRRILVGACTVLLLSSAVMLLLPRKKATEIPPPKPFEQSTTPGEKAPAKSDAAPKQKAGDKGADASGSIEDGARATVAAADATVDTSAPLPGMIVHRNLAPIAQQTASIDAQNGTGGSSSVFSFRGNGASAATPSIETGALKLPTVNGRDAVTAEANGGPARVRPQDLPAAAIGPLSLRMAAAGGDPSAEFEVAARFAEGKGVQQDFGEAVTWYKRSADHGFAVAQYRLGTLYERGLGVHADARQARTWYAKAAEAGNIKAMHNLAVLSASRERGSPDYTTASHWFQQAAERGLADSQYNIAVLYETGLGVPRDLKQAYKWFSIAARGGDKESKRRLELVKMKLDANEIGAANQLVATWRPAAYDRMANDPFAAGQAWKQRVGTSAS
jgi:localization factor PodJL